jgi:hypothetical protein
MPVTPRLDIINEVEREADNESWFMPPSQLAPSIENIRPKAPAIVVQDKVPDIEIQGEQELYFFDQDRLSAVQSVVSSHGTVFLWNQLKELMTDFDDEKK